LAKDTRYNKVILSNGEDLYILLSCQWYNHSRKTTDMLTIRLKSFLFGDLTGASEDLPKFVLYLQCGEV